MSVTIATSTPAWTKGAPHHSIPDMPHRSPDSATRRLAELDTLINTVESMRHRAADCALLHINDMCQLAATQLARLRRGELPLTINRLDVLRHCARTGPAGRPAFRRRGARRAGDRQRPCPAVLAVGQHARRRWPGAPGHAQARLLPVGARQVPAGPGRRPDLDGGLDLAGPALDRLAQRQHRRAA
ncbi:hypothetical protein LP419_35610 [Massilia sp. H-1]|nr:hypothetical protein LP419_35610 [Massilia sp. H-1]